MKTFPERFVAQERGGAHGWSSPNNLIQAFCEKSLHFPLTAVELIRGKDQTDSQSNIIEKKWLRLNV